MNICKTCNCDITKYKLKRIGKSSRFWWFYLLMILMIGTGWLLLALVIYFCMSRKYCPICKNVFYKKKKEIINEKNIKNDNEYLNNDFWNYHDNLFESILEKRGNIDNFFYDTKNQAFINEYHLSILDYLEEQNINLVKILKLTKKIMVFFRAK